MVAMERRMKTTQIALFVFAACALSGATQAADLLSLYRDAIAYDAQYAAARASLDAGRERLPQGRAGLLPNISLSGNTTWNDIDSSLRTQPPVDVPSKYNSNGWTVQLSQPLFRWQNWAGYKQSEFAVVQAEASFGLAKQDLIVRVAQAYFDVLLAQESLATAQAQKVAIAEQLESAKRNFEVGTATITDSHEAQARYDLTVAQEISAQNDLQVKQQALRTIVGKEPAAMKTLRIGMQIGKPQPDDINKWVESAETGSFSVLSAQAGLEIATREAEKQRAGHYPTVDMVATRGRSSMSGGSLSLPSGGVDSTSSTIGLQLAIPIYAGGAVASRDREALALREKAAADLENAKRQAALGARQAYLGVSAGLAQVKALEAALVSSQSALDSNKLGYEVGVRINIDVLNSQQQLYSTRRDLAKARLDTLAAVLKLKYAAGTLVEEDVQAINALLE
jgi:outer membrane protein